jgi:hypothetical protein
VDREGTKDILGLWIEQTEGAKFWLKVITELKNRGVADLLIAVLDGLKGFPEALRVREKRRTCAAVDKSNRPRHTQNSGHYLYQPLISRCKLPVGAIPSSPS